MKDDILLKLHKTLLYIMDEIDKICEKNKINYSLIGGSMIGAVRHKGFIPWDDDIDVAMLREDYEKFARVCYSTLDDKFQWQSILTDPDYPYGFGKLILKGTECISAGHENEKWQKGIYVDVFPLDDIPTNKYLQKKHKFCNLLLIKMLERKMKGKIINKNLNKIIIFHLIDILNIFVSFNFLRKKLEKNMLRYEKSNSEIVSNLGGYYGYEKEMTYKKYFKKFIRVPFEDRNYYIIKEYDLYLTSVYGDYMKMPPEDKRRTHEFIILEFGEYENI